MNSCVLGKTAWTENRKTIQIKNYLKDKLNPTRYTHVLAVRDLAIDLARKHSADLQKVNLAVLLHDCAKWMSPRELYKAAAHYGLQLDEVERLNPSVLHATIGAEVAVECFSVSQPEILSAIRAHTTGNGVMPLIDKILYVADFAEPNRASEESRVVRELAYTNLDEAVMEVSRRKIENLLTKGAFIHPNTIDAYNGALRNIRGTG